MTKRSEQTKQKQQYLYGDLMTGLSYSLFMPMYCKNWIDDPCFGSPFVVGFLFSACVLHWISWFQTNRMLSVTAFLLQVGCFTTMACFEWPYKQDSTLIPQFLWALIHTSSNLALDVTTKSVMIVYALFWTTVSTLSTDTLPTMPTLMVCYGSATVTLFLHNKASLVPKGLSSEIFSARVAFLILAGAYAFHLGREIIWMASLPGYAARGGYNIIQGGFLAILGIAAAGAFKDQVGIKESLQIMLRRSGEELAKQTEILEMVNMALQASETAIAIVDSEQRIIWTNAALEKLLGYVPKCRTYRKESPLLLDQMDLPESEKASFRRYFSTFVQTKTQATLQGRSVAIMISPFMEQGHNERYSDTKDRPSRMRFLVAMTDVTDIKARETAEKAAQQAATQRKAMEESMETLTHELRTPLQGIIGMTSLVLDSNSKDKLSIDEAIECMNTVMASSRLLLTLINNLLDSHKMSAKMMDDFVLKPNDLLDVTTEAYQFCRPVASINDTHVDLIIDISEQEKLCVKTNAVRYQQVLVNLVSNAIKYADKSDIAIRLEVLPVERVLDRIGEALFASEVSFLSERENVNLAVISVEDSGKGIPEDFQHDIFSRFSQYGDDKHISKFGTGTGLGLNLCMKFVQRMNGCIWVVNRKEHGACFSFCLPIASSQERIQCDSEKVQGELFHKSDSTLPEASQIAHKILVVDDTLINLKVLDRMLKRISPLNDVVIVSSGFEALNRIGDKEFDVVFSDIQMPEMDGIELCHRIGRLNLAIPPVLVALTAETSESLEQRCSAVGISHILHKPLSAAQLRAFFDVTLPTLSHPLSVH